MKNETYMEAMMTLASDYDQMSQELFRLAHKLEDTPGYNPKNEMYSLVRTAEQATVGLRGLAARTEWEKARELYELLKRRGIQASYIDRDTSVFERGLTVTTFYLAKGLEFDQVFSVFEEEENPLMTQAKYICATRALHELYMYTVSL